jgi:hypothetical protein
MTSTRRQSQQLMLGPLEMQVMNVAWSVGRCSVRDVVERLNSKLAYTTVMTTLDRLFKKGLLEREKSERAFLYSPRCPARIGSEGARAIWWLGFLPVRSLPAIFCCLLWLMPSANTMPCCWTNWKRRSARSAASFPGCPSHEPSLHHAAAVPLLGFVFHGPHGAGDGCALWAQVRQCELPST